jgi:hypothetical protein
MPLFDTRRVGGAFADTEMRDFWGYAGGELATKAETPPDAGSLARWPQLP